MHSLKSSATRFICARKSWHIDHRGDIRGAENGTPMLEGPHPYPLPMVNFEATRLPGA